MFRTHVQRIAGAAGLACSAAALAGPVSLHFSNCTSPVPAQMVIDVGPNHAMCHVPPGAPSPIVRDMALQALTIAGVPATPGPGIDECAVPNAPVGSFFDINTLTTGQLRVSMATPNLTSAQNIFAGHFAPLDASRAPAIFTAGIITDVGELSAQVSAQELNFQTDGPIICQALFQRLAPRAPQYGAQINYAGDRLEVYFDPAYTVTQGGIIFGTTSPSQGAQGVLIVPQPPPPPCPADFNGDGVVNSQDFFSFLSAFFRQDPAADYNRDGQVNSQDFFDFLQDFLRGC